MSILQLSNHELSWVSESRHTDKKVILENYFSLQVSGIYKHDKKKKSSESNTSPVE